MSEQRRHHLLRDGNLNHATNHVLYRVSDECHLLLFLVFLRQWIILSHRRKLLQLDRTPSIVQMSLE
jgi:hypothetical protein